MSKIEGKQAVSRGSPLSNLNLKISEDERWEFKEWCVKRRMSQVDAFRLAFALLRKVDEGSKPDG